MWLTLGQQHKKTNKQNGAGTHFTEQRTQTYKSPEEITEGSLLASEARKGPFSPKFRLKHNASWRSSQNRTHRTPHQQRPSPAHPKPNRSPPRKAPRVEPLLSALSNRAALKATLPRLPQFAKKPPRVPYRTPPIWGCRDNPEAGTSSRQLRSSPLPRSPGPGGGAGRKRKRVGWSSGGARTPSRVPPAGGAGLPPPPRPRRPALAAPSGAPSPLPPLLGREPGSGRPRILPPGPASRASHPLARGPPRGGVAVGGSVGQRPPALGRRSPRLRRFPGDASADTAAPRAFARS